MTTTTIELKPLEPEISTQALTLRESALAMRVIDDQSCQQASAVLKNVVGLRKRISDFFAPMKEAAHKAHKAITSSEKEALGALDPVDTYLRQQISTYQTEQARKAAAEQARLDEERRKEQARLDAIAEAARKAEAEERQRQADELRAKAAAEKAEQDRIAAELAAQGRAEEAARQQAAAEAAAKAQAEAAAQILAAPSAVAAAPVVQREVVAQTKPAIPTRTVWEFVIEDAEKLPRQYLMPNEAAIREAVTALKGATAIPGVKVTSREVPVVKTGK